MKLNRQRLRWLVPLFIILIGGSIFSLASGFLLRGYDPRIQDQSIKPASSPTSFSYTISIQAHAITPTAGHSSVSTPTPRPTNQPYQPAPTGTTPTGINYTTLPPGSALPGDSTCASNVTRSAFEPRPDNYAANHQVPTAAQIANLHPWNPLIGMNDKSDSLRQRVTGNFTGTTDEILQWEFQGCKFATCAAVGT